MKMTWEQAAENRRECYHFLSRLKGASPENVEANRLAIQALERMIPEQIRYSQKYQDDDTTSISGRCPVCGTGFSWNYYGDPKVIYCHRCGKAMHA